MAGKAAVAAWLGTLLLVTLSASCGKQAFLSPRQSPTPTSTASTTPTPTATPTAGLVFATNRADGMLTVFSRNFFTGVLDLIGTTGVGAAHGPTGVALSPSNNFLYVANAADATIREFSVDTSTGALAGIGSVSDGTNSSPQRIAIDASGSFLYVTNQGGGGSVSEYQVASDGTLKAIGTFLGAGLTQPLGIAAAPGGGAIYVADEGAGNVMSFVIGTDGSLTRVSILPSLGPVRGPGQPREVAVDPGGAFIYVTDVSTGVVSVFGVGAGNVLTFSATYPTAAITNQPFGVALANNSAGLFLYTTDDLIDSVSNFIVTAGVPSLQGSTSGLRSPAGIVADPTGSVVYVANSGSGQVTAYSVGANSALNTIGTFDTESPANPTSAPMFLAITQ